MAKVEILVAGKLYGGWKDVQIRRSLKAIAGGFSLSITDRWSGQNAPWILKPGDACELRVKGETLITGYLDSVSPSYNASSRTIEVSGRDKTADFVDCSADIGQFQLKGLKLETVAQKLAQQFGLPVKFTGSSGEPIEVVSINVGETAFEVLEKACRQKGFLLTTDGKGSVIITRPSSERCATALEQGKNILSASAQYDFTSRYSEYRVVSQYSEFATELGVGAYTIQGKASDPTITRKRVLILNSENSGISGDAKKRAEWEATVRAARSGKFKVTVQGWEQEDGTIWKPNQLVRVKSDWIGLNSDLLISSVAMSLGERSGTTTELELERPDAYQPEPIVSTSKDPLANEIKKELRQ